MKYNSIQELVDIATRENKKISEICIKDQARQLEMSEEEIFQKMEESFLVMIESAKPNQTLRSTSGLTGGEGYQMMEYANKSEGGLSGRFLTRAMARAMAVSNCNAAMGKIVAAPTAGSCGILPGGLVSMYEDGRAKKEDGIRGHLAWLLQRELRLQGHRVDVRQNVGRLREWPQQHLLNYREEHHSNVRMPLEWRLSIS